MTRTTINRTAIACAVVAAQFASRPADEWRKVLDAPERVAALKVNEVVARLHLKPTNVVAHLGAGTGPFVVPFATAVPSGTVYAVEVDERLPPLIAREDERGRRHECADRAGRLHRPEVAGGTVDVAFMHDVLHHIGDRRRISGP